MLDDGQWFSQQVEDLTSEISVMSPSEWAENSRYLPPSVTPLPGYFSFDVAPYLK